MHCSAYSGSQSRPATPPTASFERLGDREVAASWLTCGCPARTASNPSGTLVAEKVALPVILISVHADVPMTVAAIKSGAEDPIEKPIDDAHLVAAISRAFARRFEQQDLRNSRQALGMKFARLTPRQGEIFDLVVEGLTSYAIAAKLNISVRTVESYRVEIIEKMQAESVAVPVRQAIRLGRIAP
jgi:two-component system response regulator FixJ